MQKIGLIGLVRIYMNWFEWPRARKILKEFIEELKTCTNRKYKTETKLTVIFKY